MKISSHGRISPEFPLGLALERLGELRITVTVPDAEFGVGHRGADLGLQSFPRAGLGDKAEGGGIIEGLASMVLLLKGASSGSEPRAILRSRRWAEDRSRTREGRIPLRAKRFR